jgi:hypothetical protein
MPISHRLFSRSDFHVPSLQRATHRSTFAVRCTNDPQADVVVVHLQAKPMFLPLVKGKSVTDLTPCHQDTRDVRIRQPETLVWTVPGALVAPYLIHHTDPTPSASSIHPLPPPDSASSDRMVPLGSSELHRQDSLRHKQGTEHRSRSSCLYVFLSPSPSSSSL